MIFGLEGEQKFYMPLTVFFSMLISFLAGIKWLLVFFGCYHSSGSSDLGDLGGLRCIDNR